MGQTERSNRLEPARARRRRAHGLEAVTAVHGASAARLEWDLGRTAAVGADSVVQLARGASDLRRVRARAAAAARVRAPVGAAAAAALGFQVAPRSEELLIIGRKEKFAAALNTRERFVIVSHAKALQGRPPPRVYRPVVAGQLHPAAAGPAQSESAFESRSFGRGFGYWCCQQSAISL